MARGSRGLGESTGTFMGAALLAALVLAAQAAPSAVARMVEPTPPKPGHCRWAEQQLDGTTTVSPPDPRFDWRRWLDEAPEVTSLPCGPETAFGVTLPPHMIPSWVLDELRQR